MAHPAARSVVFCCSIPHARFVKAWLTAQGLKVQAVHSAEDSDDRDSALDALARGELDALCAVDVINEGVDVPAIDRVIMLRPTESGALFLQQLGRGLRAAPGKPALTVIDFVGNHRVFLDRLRTLLSLASDRPIDQLRRLLDDSTLLELPEGCAVELELEAKEALAAMFKVGGADEVERAYRELKATQAERPTAGELLRLGYLPSKLHGRHGSWFGFVAAEGDLGDDQPTFESFRAFLDELEITPLPNALKMVALLALLDRGAFAEGLPLPELADLGHQILRRSPELSADLREEHRAPLNDATRPSWHQHWRLGGVGG